MISIPRLFYTDYTLLLVEASYGTVHSVGRECRRLQPALIWFLTCLLRRRRKLRLLDADKICSGHNKRLCQRFEYRELTIPRSFVAVHPGERNNIHDIHRRIGVAIQLRCLAHVGGKWLSQRSQLAIIQSLVVIQFQQTVLCLFVVRMLTKQSSSQITVIIRSPDACSLLFFLFSH